MLSSVRFKWIAISCEALNCLAHDSSWKNDEPIVRYGTLGDQTIYTRFGLICLFTLLFIFGLSLPKGNAHGANDGFAAVGGMSKLCQLIYLS